MAKHVFRTPGAIAVLVGFISLAWANPPAAPPAPAAPAPTAAAASSKWRPIEEVIPIAETGDSNAVDELCGRFKYGNGTPMDLVKAKLWCGRGAALFITRSQVLYGDLHYSPNDVFKDDRIAFDMYTRASEKGHPHAYKMLYILHAMGMGTPRDREKAIAYLKLSALSGEAESVKELTLIDSLAATEADEEAAQRGDLKAQTRLAETYHMGPLVVRDVAGAVKWYRMAVAQGSAFAQNNLGDMHENGNEVPLDYAQALRLYRLAAMQNHVPGLHSLATMHEAGKGVPKSLRLAYIFYRLSSLGKEFAYFAKEAAQRAKGIAAGMSPDDLAAAEKIVLAWKPGMPLP